MKKHIKLLATGLVLTTLLVGCSDDKGKTEQEEVGQETGIKDKNGKVVEQVVDVDKEGDTTIGETQEETKVNERTKVEVSEMLVRETLGEYNAGLDKSFLIIKYTITNDNELPLQIDSLIKNAQIEHVYVEGEGEVKEVFDLDLEAQKVYLETEGKNEQTIKEGTEIAVGGSASSQYVFTINTKDWETEGHDFNLLLNGSSAKINN